MAHVAAGRRGLVARYTYWFLLLRGVVTAGRKGTVKRALWFGEWLLFCENGGMASFTGNKGKPGRPRGQQHDAEVHVRLPQEALRLFKKLARQWDANVSEVVRVFMVVGMMNLAAKSEKVITDEQATDWRRLRAISRHQQLRWAVLHLTDAGLKLARGRERQRGSERRREMH